MLVGDLGGLALGAIRSLARERERDLKLLKLSCARDRILEALFDLGPPALGGSCAGFGCLTRVDGVARRALELPRVLLGPRRRRSHLLDLRRCTRALLRQGPTRVEQLRLCVRERDVSVRDRRLASRERTIKLRDRGRFAGELGLQLRFGRSGGPLLGLEL